MTLASENWNEVHIQVLTSDFKVPEGVFYSLSDFRERNGSSLFNTKLSDDPNPFITALVVFETELWYMGVH